MRLKVALFFLLTLILVGFVKDYSKEHISKKDFKIPREFPKPYYDLKKNKITLNGFILGRKLFYDPILSSDNVTSCASCHQHFAAFAHIDHALSHGTKGKIGTRNVPALQNLIWKDSYMADGGVSHLELQPIAPITNPSEMNESLENVIKKLNSSSRYRRLFFEAFGDSIVTTEKLLKSLSQFLATLISNKAKYDLFVKGKVKFTEKEFLGLNLFRKHCESCHKEPLFTDNSYRNIGLNPFTSPRDSGRQKITGMPNDFMKFKVPSLRNVEVTYPYMHDGRFQSLQLVLNHYSKGNFYTSNVDTTILRNVGLTEKEKSAIIEFLKTLTDRDFISNKKFNAPQ